MTSNALKLTREMKIVLTVVAAGGALGGVYLWSASRTPDVSAAPGVMAPATPAEATPTPAEGGVSRPKNAAEPQQIPFLTAAPPDQPKVEAPKPAQTDNLNAALPNPFRPFNVEKSAADTPTALPGVGALPAPTVPGTVTASRPSVVAAPSIRPGDVGIGAPIALPSVGVNAAPFPVPTLPGAPRVVPLLGKLPGTLVIAAPPTAPVSGPAFGTSSAPTTEPSPVSAPKPLPVTPAPAPPKPPVPSVRAPSAPPTLSTPANMAAATPNSATPGAVPAGVTPPNAAIPGATTPSFTPAVPALVAELGAPPAPPESAGQAAAEVTAPAPVAPDPLGDYIAQRDLSYNAVVLGPVNTGIFQTKGGYVVVSIGQKLPDSDIVVKDITASAVTLALGDSQKILELDKR